MQHNEALSLLRIEDTHIDESLIRRAFRCRVKDVHPDTGGSAELFNALVDARTLLLNGLAVELPTIEIRMISSDIGKVAVQCPACQGKISTSTCKVCYGRGECKHCRGRGYVTRQCARCNNFGTVTVDVRLSPDRQVVIAGTRYRAVVV